jgi:antitoxin HigA-1
MPITAIHPGEHLAEELKALDMSASELSRKIEVPTNCVTQILNGTRSVSGDTALRLAHFLALAHSSGSICKRFTTYAWLKRGAGNPSRHFPLLLALLRLDANFALR